MVAMTVRDQDQVGGHLIRFDRRLGIARQEWVDQNASAVALEQKGCMPKPSHAGRHGRLSSQNALVQPIRRIQYVASSLNHPARAHGLAIRKSQFESGPAV